jgi:hypothetical protein
MNETILLKECRPMITEYLQEHGTPPGPQPNGSTSVSKILLPNSFEFFQMLPKFCSPVPKELPTSKVISTSLSAPPLAPSLMALQHQS